METTTELYMWRVPRSYVREGDEPYRAEITQSDTHWNPGAVMVGQTKVTMIAPEATPQEADAAQAEALQAKVKDVQAEAAVEVAALKERINSLLAITHEQ